MAQLVAATASMSCTFGVAPAVLIVTFPTVTADKKPAANINDAIPVTNIPTFGMCSSLTNPATASATAAASGVLTPTPCVPVTVAWVPGSPTVQLRKMPALNNTSKCNCSYLGVISITMAGTMTVTVA